MAKIYPIFNHCLSAILYLCLFILNKNITISTKQWIIDPDSTNKLTITSSILPELSPNQVLVKVHAVSLNYRDKLEIENFPTNNMTQPFTPTSDMAGEVIQIGTEVTQFSVGDKVINSFYHEWLNGHFHGTLTQKIKTFGTSALNGVLSEYVVFSVENLVRLPQNLSYIEASTLACAAVTAWQALIKEGHLKAG